MRSKKGSLSYVLSRTIDIVFSALIVLLILFIVFLLYSTFFGEDRLVTNQYVLTGDMLQGVIDTPGETERSFGFTFLHNEKNKEFDGTIFGISSDGTWTTPLPPVNWYTRDAEETLTGEDITRFVTEKKTTEVSAEKLSLSRVDKACENAACLCLSKRPLVSTTGDTELLKTLRAIEECRAFELPSNTRAINLNFEELQTLEQDHPWYRNLFGAEDSEPVYEEGMFPKLTLRKEPCADDAICIFAFMSAEHTAANAENA
jgi:hypothetical protein